MEHRAQPIPPSRKPSVLNFLVSLFFIVSFRVNFAQACTTCSNVTDAVEVGYPVDLEHSRIDKRYANRPKWNNYRLPKFAHPLRYDLTLHLDPRKMQFEGEVSIKIRMTKTTRFLVLHAKNLRITSLTLLPFDDDGYRRRRGSSYENEAYSNDGGGDFLATEKDVIHVPHHEQIIIRTGQALLNGDVIVLRIHYQGWMSRFSRGLQLSHHRKTDGSVSPVISTQLESTFARLVLPCWDEPEFRAVFKISIVRRSALFSLSTMPLRTTIDADYSQSNMARDEFLETPPMSPHLLSILVARSAEYDELGQVAGNGRTKVYVWAPKTLIARGKMALDIAVRIIPILEGRFGSEYPLPKLDLVAVPDTSPMPYHGWGLKFFQPAFLLVDETRTSAVMKQELVERVIERVARDWIGGASTVHWWNEVWIKEAITQNVAFVMNQIKPEWDMQDYVAMRYSTAGLIIDSLASSRALTLPHVSSVSEIEQLNDDVLCKKGTSLLTWLALDPTGSIPNVLGTILNRFRFKTFVVDDIVSAIASDPRTKIQNFKEFAHSWIDKPGHPYVRVELADGILYARQRRFSDVGVNCTALREVGGEGAAQSKTAVVNYGRAPSCNDVWGLSLVCIVGTADGRVHTVAAHLHSHETVEIKLPPNVNYVKCNQQGLGFYKVSYAKGLWTMLRTAVSHNPAMFHRSDRASMIRDSIAMTWFKEKPRKIQASLELASTILPREHDLVVWSLANTEFACILTAVKSGSPLGDKFRRFWLQMMMPVKQKLGWSYHGSHADRILRGKLLEISIELDDYPTIQQAAELFEKWRVSIDGVAGASVISSAETEYKEVYRPNADIRIAVIMGGVRVHGKVALEFAWKVYSSSRQPTIRLDVLIALARSLPSGTLRWLLSQALNPEAISMENLPVILENALRNPHGLPEVWHFLTSNWDFLHETQVAYPLGVVVRETLASMVDHRRLYEAEAFFARLGPYRVARVERSIRQGLELARLKIFWASWHAQELDIWLNRNHTRTY